MAGHNPITFEVRPGSTLTRACLTMLKIAVALDQPVSTTFNDTPLEARPDDADTDAVLFRYWAARGVMQQAAR